MKPLRWLLAALVVLAVGWALTPASAPPVYDGVGFPDEPYRFVTHVDGSTATKKATTATASAPVTGGQTGAVVANTAEQAPQLSLLIPVGRLVAPKGTSQVVVTARPVAPIAAPAGKYLWSDVYTITATPAATTFVARDPQATLTMRAGSAQRPVPAIERRTATGWTPLQTEAVGRDIYQAALPGLGTYAVFGTEPLNLTTDDRTNMTGIVIAVVAGLLVVALVVVAVLRRRRHGGHGAPEDFEEAPEPQGDVAT